MQFAAQLASKLLVAGLDAAARLVVDEFKMIKASSIPSILNDSPTALGISIDFGLNHPNTAARLI